MAEAIKRTWPAFVAEFKLLWLALVTLCKIAIKVVIVTGNLIVAITEVYVAVWFILHVGLGLR